MNYSVQLEIYDDLCSTEAIRTEQVEREQSEHRT